MSFFRTKRFPVEIYEDVLREIGIIGEVTINSLEIQLRVALLAKGWDEDSVKSVVSLIIKGV